MKLKIEIQMDNAAFNEASNGNECGRILRRLAGNIKDADLDVEFRGGLYDLNGNRVGEVKVTR